MESDKRAWAENPIYLHNKNILQLCIDTYCLLVCQEFELYERKFPDILSMACKTKFNGYFIL